MSICYEWAMDMALQWLTATGTHIPTAIVMGEQWEVHVYKDATEEEAQAYFMRLPEPKLLVWARQDEYITDVWLLVHEKHSHEVHRRTIYSGKHYTGSPDEALKRGQAEQHHSQPVEGADSHKACHDPEEGSEQPHDRSQ